MSNCSSCKYRKSIPGDAHISCEFPLVDKMELIKYLTTEPHNYKKIIKNNYGFSIMDGGIENGYVLFPLNFDPSWFNGDCLKHSDLVGEAVEYQIKISELLKPIRELIKEIDSGSKNKENYKEFLSAFENTMKAFEENSKPTTKKEIKDARDSFVLELEKINKTFL